MAMEELGPTFVKLGQLLSTRGDIVSDSMIVELSRLQERVAPVPWDKAVAIIEGELGRPLSALFRSVDPTPLAAASISQVYRGVTHDGQEVAIKVQRPGIRASVETDLEIMEHLAGLVERNIAEAAVFEPTKMVQEFRRTILRELDFRSEANHMDHISRLFRDHRAFQVPSVYRALSSRRVLTMSFVDGTCVADFDTLRAAGADFRVIAQNLVDVLFTQVFEHGFYHADPHPGNIRVLEGNRIVMLDYGMVGIMTARAREHLSALIMGLVRRDECRVTNAVFRLSGYVDTSVRARVEADVANFIQEHLCRPLGEVRLGDVLNELTRLLVVYSIHMPSSFFLLTKLISSTEGLISRLVPDMNVVEYMAPFAKRLIRRRFSARRTLRKAVPVIGELQELVSDLPGDARQILGVLRRGEVKVNLSGSRFEEFLRLQDQVSNRTVFGIVLAALIIGSSLMSLAGTRLEWDTIPPVGLAGFVISGIMGFSLLYSIIKHGRM
jgi:ubiquinone biosynthesis protein